MEFLKDSKLIFRRTLNFDCSYLNGKKEKRLYINLLNSDKTDHLISDLTKNGFRRSLTICISQYAKVVIFAYPQELI